MLFAHSYDDLQAYASKNLQRRRLTMENRRWIIVLAAHSGWLLGCDRRLTIFELFYGRHRVIYYLRGCIIQVPVKIYAGQDQVTIYLRQ